MRNFLQSFLNETFIIKKLLFLKNRNWKTHINKISTIPYDLENIITNTSNNLFNNFLLLAISNRIDTN